MALNVAADPLLHFGRWLPKEHRAGGFIYRRAFRHLAVPDGELLSER